MEKIEVVGYARASRSAIDDGPSGDVAVRITIGGEDSGDLALERGQGHSDDARAGSVGGSGSSFGARIKPRRPPLARRPLTTRGISS